MDILSIWFLDDFSHLSSDSSLFLFFFPQVRRATGKRWRIRRIPEEAGVVKLFFCAGAVAVIESERKVRQQAKDAENRSDCRVLKLPLSVKKYIHVTTKGMSKFGCDIKACLKRSVLRVYTKIQQLWFHKIKPFITILIFLKVSALAWNPQNVANSSRTRTKRAPETNLAC